MHFDPYNRPFCKGERTAEPFSRVKADIDEAIACGLAYAHYADMLQCETANPYLEGAKKFAEAIDAKYPDQLSAYNRLPSFNCKKNLDNATIVKFQTELSAIGYM